MVFHCTFPDKSLCPPYYMVLFHGPTRQSVLPENFSELNWTYTSPDDFASVNAKWTIHDAGQYLVYAYPQFIYCGKWKEMEFPWEKATVQGTPLTISVIPGTSATEEGYQVCSANDIDAGRYLSTNPKVSSKEFADMYAGSGRDFVWAPYKCKIPHRTITEAIDLMPPAKHFLFCRRLIDERGVLCADMGEFARYRARRSMRLQEFARGILGYEMGS